MSDGSPLTKRLHGSDDGGVSPDPVEIVRLEQNDGETGEAALPSLPSTPASVTQPSQQPQQQQQQQLTPQPIPIQPYFPYPPYVHYPGVTYHFPPAGNNGYTDCSTMMDPPNDSRRNKGGVTEPFPEKLHRMLTACEQEGLGDVVSFFPHGRAFAIHKPRMFQDKVMKRFFRQSRLSSFTRQLNLYGFHRISTGPDHGGYYHELFLRGRPGLCVNMKRVKIKGEHGHRRRGDGEYEGEPNFYAMAPITIPPAPAPAPAASGTSQTSSNPANNAAPAPQLQQLQPIPVAYGYPPLGFAPPPGYAPFSLPQQQQMPYTAAQSTTPAGAPQQQVYPFSPPPMLGFPPQQPWQQAPQGLVPSPNPGPATPEAAPTTTTTSPAKPQEVAEPV